MPENKKKRNARQYAWQKENTERINFTMEPGTKNRIKSAAAARNISAAEWIREAIRDKLETKNNY